MLPTGQPSAIGHLVAVLGGTGKDSAPFIRAAHERDGSPFPMLIAQIDTDPVSTKAADTAMSLNMTPAKLKALRANPTLYGEVAAHILHDCAALLDAEDFENGSRTLRALTQLCFIYHTDEILAFLRR